MTKSKEEIIMMMCYTYRHDFGLPKEKDPGGYSFPYLAGTTKEEREAIYNQMSQIFDNCIAPYMEFKNG